MRGRRFVAVVTAGVVTTAVAIVGAVAAQAAPQPHGGAGLHRPGVPVSAPPKITTSSLPAAQQGVAYRVAFAFTCADGPCRTSLAGPLPPGLRYDATDATLSGTPTTTGKYPVTFAVVDAAKRKASRRFGGFGVYVGPTLTSPVPDGDAATPYDAPLEVSGGSAPYSVVVSAGALPPGLDLVDAGGTGPTIGSIQGSPTMTGSYSFTLTVSAGHGLANSFPESVAIAAAPTITTTELAAGRTGIAYDQSLAVTGGTAPFTWSVSQGTLPAGLALDPSTGDVSGQPDLSASTPLTIEVTDAVGGAASEAFTLTVALWKPPLVTTGSLVGASVFPNHGEPRSGQIAALENQVGRTLDIDNSYYGWKDGLVGTVAHHDMAAGRIPLDSWSCADPSDIVNGEFDKQLETQAAQVKAFAYPIYLRWSWEMDQGANHVCANNDGSAMFVKAWQHIWTIFDNAGATNAAWVWCPSHAAFANGTAMKYYPGPGYVDYVCADGYSRSVDSPTSFASLFGPLYKAWSTLKPILIGETGQVPGKTQAGWITQTAKTISTDYPDIKAFLYWDSKMNYDYTMTTHASLTAFAALVRSAYFNPLDKPLGPTNIPPPA